MILYSIFSSQMSSRRSRELCTVKLEYWEYMRRLFSVELQARILIVVVVFEGGQQHFLGGVRINGIDAVAEAFLLVQQTRCQYPDAGIGVRSLPVSLRGEKYGDQGRLSPV